MPINPEKTVRKNVAMAIDLWKRVSAWQKKQKIGSESKALARLIDAGLRNEEHSGQETSRRRSS